MITTLPFWFVQCHFHSMFPLPFVSNNINIICKLQKNAHKEDFNFHRCQIITHIFSCLCKDSQNDNISIWLLVEYLGHSHILFAIVEKMSETGFMLKPLKQKQMVDGLCYLLQEIYGIENKNNERSKVYYHYFIVSYRNGWLCCVIL